MSETYYKVYYSKDVKKKKKNYAEGIYMESANKIKLFDENSTLVYQGAIRNKYFHNVETEEEFIIGNIYYGKRSDNLVSIDKPVSKERFLNGTAFMQKPQPMTFAKKAKKVTIEQEVKKVEEGSIDLGLDYRIDQFIAQKLRPHQIQGIKFMFDCITGKKNSSNFGCILADFMGLGKTLQTLTLLYSCLKNTLKAKSFNKAIVVSPLSLVKVWQKQLSKWFQDKIIPIVASGDSATIRYKVESFVKDKYRLLFISYQSFIKHMKILNGNCDIVVFDQGHRLKNDKSKSYKTIKTFSCKRRILLTGTPLQNNMEQFYACICLVNPNLFMSDLLFKNVFKKPIESAMKSTATQPQLKIGLERSKQLTSIVKQFSLRRKCDVIEDILPAKKQYHVFLPLTQFQNKWSNKFIKQNGNDDILFLITMLRKLIISSLLFKQTLINKGYNFSGYTDDTTSDISSKVQFIIKVARNCNILHQKLIVVSNYTQNLTFIQNLLQQQNITCYRLDGSMTDTVRQIKIQKFRSSSHGSVFLLSSKAGGTGLNLTVANKMILMEPDWNPSNDQQVMGRVWRDGQTKPVHIYRLIAMSTFEERILQRQYLKQSLSDKLIDASSVTRLFNLNEMRKLLILNEKKCLTYQKEANQLNEVKCWNIDFKQVNEETFVWIRKDKNELTGVNEFENDDMFLQVEKQQDEDEIIEKQEAQIQSDNSSSDEEKQKVEKKVFFETPKVEKQQSENEPKENINQQNLKIEVLEKSVFNQIAFQKQQQKFESEPIAKPKLYINPLLRKTKNVQKVLSSQSQSNPSQKIKQQDEKQKQLIKYTLI